MKIKVADFRAAFEPLKRLLQVEMEFKLMYRLNKITKKVIREMEEQEELRVKLIKKYGFINDKNQYEVAKDKVEEFTKEWVSILNDEIELDIQKIPYELLEKSNIKVSAAEMCYLELFIDEPKEKT